MPGSLRPACFFGSGKLIHPLYLGADTLNERYYIAMSAIVLIAFVILVANARRTRRAISNMALIPLAAGCGVQILSYTTTAYGGTKEWYWVSQMILVTLAGSMLLHLILRPLQRIKPLRFTLEIRLDCAERLHGVWILAGH